MTDTRVRINIAVTWMLAQIGIILLVFLLFVQGGFLFTEMTTTIALIAPMFTGFLSIMLTQITSERYRVAKKGRRLTGVYVFSLFFIVLTFIISILCAVLLKAYNKGFQDFEQFKIFLGIIETLFVAFVGQLVRPLFETPQPRSNRSGAHDTSTVDSS